MTLHIPGFSRVIEEELLLVDFSICGVDGDDGVAHLIGPRIHQLGNVYGFTILIFSLPSSHNKSFCVVQSHTVLST